MNSSIVSIEPANKDIIIFDNILNKYGWYLDKFDIGDISYTKVGDETSCVIIKIFNNKINVSVPIKNSPYQYNTTFKDYNHAIEYIENRLIDYN